MTVISRAAATVCLALLSPFAVQAASLRISPIGVELPDNERAASVTLGNTDTKPVNLQVRLFKWTQVDGEDKLEPTNEMLVSPPAVTVPAGASYTIRVARPSAKPVQQELSYRLFVDELPEPVDPAAPAQGVSMVLRTSMPVFVSNKKAVAQLAWRAWHEGGELKVMVSNAGQRNARIAAADLEIADGSKIQLADGLLGYVLAGQSRTFSFENKDGKFSSLVSGTKVTLVAKDRLVEIREPIVVSPR